MFRSDPGHSPRSFRSFKGRIYFTSDNGETTVIKAGAAFEVLAKDPLDETVQASPAISRGQIFIRTEKHLLAIGRNE